jgi:hypothetical protein
MNDAEALCRGLLTNAAARQVAVNRTEPERPSADYLTGFGAGWESGHVAALAMALSVMTGDSPTDLVNEAMAQAAVDAAFPMELQIDTGDADVA